ncbi:SF3a splicing factor complex subunit [Mucor velutinosus]|uniref:SF3a splicing factor complex subunit n=1 Tax=Mucor velutinosus TaxID=708070 RepID=A0AAN7D319_9FUNG|nr:SF3a splicing factor complex subunit [Mucor velutinosus]
MLCDPLQKSTLNCPDKYCSATNMTFAVCEYNIAKDANNQTAFTYTGCADTSNLSCDAFKACSLFNIYVMQHGINQTSAAANGTKYVSRCTGSITTTTTTSGNTTTSNGNGISTASIGNMHQALCTSILLFICFLTISMSKRLL